MRKPRNTKFSSIKSDFIPEYFWLRGKEIRNGLIGGISLLLFYFIVMTVASRSWSATISQFRELWYWMIILSTGFGIQIGLFTHLQNIIKHHQMAGNPKAIAATSTGTSAISMIACCVHHLSDVLPIIGLSGLAVFLTQYQIPLILLGVTMNVFGIFYMIGQINKIKGNTNNFGFLSRITNINKVLSVAFILILIIVVYTISKSGNNNIASSSQNQTTTKQQSTGKFTSQVNEEANVSIEVTPKVAEIGKDTQFQIAFNTHSVDLSFDVTKTVILVDDKGNNYTDSSWDGAGPGGHHRDGFLSFNTPLKDTKYIELIIKDVAGVPERKFRWNI